MNGLTNEIKSHVGEEIKEFLTAHLNSMLDIRNIQKYETDKAQAIELKAQLKAFDKLAQILSQWIDIENRQENDIKEDYSFN